MSLARPNEHDVAVALLATEPKYRRYTQQVDKCLSTFDNVQDWADCTAFLTKLLKTLSTYPQFREIPRKLVVSKRLAQCLNPALPTGVHQRALDVYSHILATIGTDNLKRDIHIWSVGVFPFYEYSATAVKSTLLGLFHEYFLLLGPDIRALARAFILALLPGIEEESSEHFEQTLNLLDEIRRNITSALFFQNVWLIMLSAPAARASALLLLEKRLPKLQSEEELVSTVGRDVGLMIRAVSTVLEDNSLLVCRAALDLIVQYLPAHGVALKRAQLDDKFILVYAALKIVLRRDLSLNRRLYKWLLGPNEESGQQMEYLKRNTQELVCGTLRCSMETDRKTGDNIAPGPTAVPWKIFICLLDKWEIGSPLTECLIYDALTVCYESYTLDSSRDTEIFITMHQLFEAVQPWAFWKKIFANVYFELSSPTHRTEPFRIAGFVVSEFTVQDQESQLVHLPTIFCACAEFLVSCNNKDTDLSRAALCETIKMMTVFVKSIPSQALLSSAEIPTDKVANRGLSSIDQACLLYEVVQRTGNKDSICTFSSILSAGLKSCFYLLHLWASEDPLKRPDSYAEIYKTILAYGLALLARVNEVDSSGVQTDALFSIVKSSESMEFPQLSLTIDFLLTLSRKTDFFARCLDSYEYSRLLFNSLLRFLRRDMSAWHVSAVKYIWKLDAFARNNVLEEATAQILTTLDGDTLTSSFHVFGVLWRYTDDNQAPGSRLKTPLFRVLNCLKHEQSVIRQYAESWLRTFPKSYLHILDTVLYDLLATISDTIDAQECINGRMIPYSVYREEMDQRYFLYLLKSFLPFLQCTAPSLLKTMQSTPMRKSTNSLLFNLAVKHRLSHDDSTYFDVVLGLMTRVLQSRPEREFQSRMDSFNDSIQLIAVDIIHTLFSTISLKVEDTPEIQAVITRKLFLATHGGCNTLQGPLLHLLHTVIYASATSIQESRDTKASQHQDGYDDEAIVHQLVLTPLLLQTLDDGLKLCYMGPTYHHWLDFLLLTIPLFRPPNSHHVLTLLDLLGHHIHLSLNELDTQWPSSGTRCRSHFLVNELDFMSLLNTLEKLTIFLCSCPFQQAQMDMNSISSDRGAGTSDSSGILGIVSSVFSTDTSSKNSDELQSSETICCRALRNCIRSIYFTWKGAVVKMIGGASTTDSHILISNRVWLRCRKTLERVYHLYPQEVYRLLISEWYTDSMARQEFDRRIYDFICIVVTTPQAIIQQTAECILEAIASKNKDNAKKILAFLQFLEGYFFDLDPNAAVDVLPQVQSLLKEFIGNFNNIRNQVLPVLRFTTVVGTKLAHLQSHERRARKDYQDLYIKILDYAVSISGRTSEVPTRSKRGPKEDNPSGRASPVARGGTPAEDKILENSNGIHQAVDSAEPSENINAYLSEYVLPKLSKIVLDADRISSTCAGIIYHLVMPAIRNRSSSLGSIPTDVMRILQEIAIIQSAARAWKGITLETFNNPNFFQQSPITGERWNILIQSLHNADKQAFAELVNRISTASSGNLFLSKEAEINSKATAIRRLSYTIFTGKKDEFMTNLAAVQEKLVEVLRSGLSPIILGEAYFCMRVLIVRFSPYNLPGLWPVVITDMLGVLESLLNDPVSESTENLRLVNSICKFIDLAVTLQTPELQMYQWMFITDTTDAIYPPENWSPRSLIDRLAEAVRIRPPKEEKAKSGMVEEGLSVELATPELRRPLLLGVSSMFDLGDLETFLTHISLTSYETLYTSRGRVDWPAVEQSLLLDFFSGR